MDNPRADVFLDMETGDPDDCMTLFLLLSHPAVHLRCVTIFPGCTNQCGFIKALLAKYGGSNIPVGCYRKENPKNHLGLGNVKLFGTDLIWKPEEADGLGHDILAQTISKFPNGVLVTGGPLGNLHQLLVHHPDIYLDRVFCQGGFAGAECVPEANQLSKFKGKKTCSTYNFTGHIPGALLMLSTKNIKTKYLVSKDVCHSVAWDKSFHQLALHFKSEAKEPWWDIMIAAMTSYLTKKGSGKLLHDPLAACAMIDPSIIQFYEVNCFTVKEKWPAWGSVPCPGSGVFISIGINKPAFYSVFLNVPLESLQAVSLKTVEDRSKNHIEEASAADSEINDT